VYISLHKARCTIINRFFFSYLAGTLCSFPRAYFPLSLKYLSMSVPPRPPCPPSFSLTLSPSLVPDYLSAPLLARSLSVLSRRFPTRGFPALSSDSPSSLFPDRHRRALANSFLSPGFPNLSLFSARFTLFSPALPLLRCRFVFRPRFYGAELEPCERSAISFATRFILLAAFL